MAKHAKLNDKELFHIVNNCKSYREAAKVTGYTRDHIKHRMADIKNKTKPVNDKAIDQREKEIVDNLKKGVSKYVITAAQNATPIHKAFFESLKVYCAHNKAELIVIPIRYQNPTSQWTVNNIKNDYWDKAVTPYLLDREITLNKNIKIMGNYKIQPTAAAPLSGLETVTGDKSGIFGHPKLQLTTVATPQNKLPKILTTTGCVTHKNYVESKAGMKGDFHHCMGAAVVEVVGGAFHLRQLNAVKSGSFIDLDKEYSPKGVVKAGRATALIMGDIHVDSANDAVTQATYVGKRSMVGVLNPEHLVFHDLLDFYSRNHHHRGNVITNYVKHHNGIDNVEEEIDRAMAFIDKYSRPNIKNIVVRSNHDEAFDRWLKESDPKFDPENALFYHKTMVVLLENAVMTKNGAKSVDPLSYWAKKKLKCIDRTRFLRRDESVMLNSIGIDNHGDKGPNGSRGSIKAFTKIGCKVFIGHTHSPGIYENAYQTGTSTHLSLEYTSGPSSWLNTHGVIYANGKRALLSIIDGEWRS